VLSPPRCRCTSTAFGYLGGRWKRRPSQPAALVRRRALVGVATPLFRRLSTAAASSSGCSLAAVAPCLLRARSPMGAGALGATLRTPRPRWSSHGCDVCHGLGARALALRGKSPAGLPAGAVGFCGLLAGGHHSTMDLEAGLIRGALRCATADGSLPCGSPCSGALVALLRRLPSGRTGSWETSRGQFGWPH
jgi:hypothetical protein